MEAEILPRLEAWTSRGNVSSDADVLRLHAEGAPMEGRCMKGEYIQRTEGERHAEVKECAK